MDKMKRHHSGRERLGAGARPLRNLPPLHHLQAFEAAARHRSLAKAAGEMRASGLALTQAIAALEERLGLKLVRSLVPSVVLTAAGEQYFQAVQTFAHQLRDRLHQQTTGGRTQVRVTAPQGLARLWLAPRLGDFTRRHPRIELVITSTERLEPLKGAGVDVALRYGGRGDDDLVALPLWADGFVAAGAPALAASADGLTPTELPAALPLIDHPAANWRDWIAVIDPRRAEVQPVLRCTDLHLAIEAACLGMGLVIAPSRLLTGLFARGRLRQVTGHAMPGQAYHALVWRERAARPPVQALLGWLEAQCAADAAGLVAPAALG